MSAARNAVLLFAGLGLAVVLGWRLRLELIILFASALFGIALYVSAAALSRRTGLSHAPAVLLLYFAGIVVGGGFVAFAGHRVSNEYGSLTERIPTALREVERRIEGEPVIGSLAPEIRTWRENMMRNGQGPPGASDEQREEAEEQRSRLIRLSLAGVSSFVVWAVLSFYFALDGKRYARAFVSLFPPRRRALGKDLVDSLARALPRWIVGRLASMAVVALLTGAALTILGIPLALALALIAGLFSFVPFLGPIAATIPAVLVTVESEPTRLLPVLIAYGVVQFLESYVITPRIESHVVSVPPVVLIASQVVMGGLVGVVGVMFATPLALTVIIVVQIVYLQHVLGEDVSVAGAPAETTS